MEERDITVFYLKFVKAEVADQLIQEILNGRSDAMGGSLLGDMASDLLGGGLMLLRCGAALEEVDRRGKGARLSPERCGSPKGLS